MKFLKYIFYLLLIFIIGTAIYFGVKSGDFDAASTRTMEIPAPVIFETVNNYKTWKDWGPWMEEDPDIKITYGDSVSGKNAWYAWDSDVQEVGKGSMKTLEVIPNKSLIQEITFNSPFGASKSQVYWEFKPIANANKTEVTWGMRGTHSLIEKIFMSFQKEPFETTLKTMFDKGLENLEKTIKTQMNTYHVTVNGITQHGGGFYLYLTTASRLSNIGDKMGPMFGEIASFIKENNITVTGMPFTIYNEIDQENQTVNFSAALPVAEKIILPSKSNILSGYMPPQTVVKVTLQGNYNYLNEAYKKAQEYILKNNLKPAPTGKMFEVYKTDPGAEPNPSKWITEIYFPIENPNDL
jgi:effector-binding domain-containing protein